MNRIVLLSATLLAMACTESAPSASAASAAGTSYAREIDDWRVQRLESLHSPYGWLNLVGLYWLSDGAQSIGSDADSSIRLPEKAPGKLGTVTKQGDAVMFIAEPGVVTTIDDAPVKSVMLVPDTEENPTNVVNGDLAFRLIERNGEFALRAWDFQHPGARAVEAIPVYETDADYRVRAVFEPYEQPRKLNVGTVIDSLDYRPVSPGLLRFEISGQELTLEAYESGDEFFLIFADTTSTSETYPAGRFLYTDLPGTDGTTVIDFNKAYNPPCAFNEFATCPIASRRNRLKVAIEAGEKYTKKLHVAY